LELFHLLNQLFILTHYIALVV